MARNHLRSITLEVERKFFCLKTNPLTRDAGAPAFKALAHVGVKTFRDVYFDHKGMLSQAGTWVRQRDGRWESKIRQAGDYNNSQFREISDIGQISRHVHSIIEHSHLQSPDAAFGLSKIADITTRRETWIADDRFNIVLDRTDFGHIVGEVELEMTVRVQSEAESQQHSALMDSEITTFMRRYDWAFDTRPAIGKLTAYFARQKS